MNSKLCVAVLLVLGSLESGWAQPPEIQKNYIQPLLRDFDVNGVNRQALVFLPKSTLKNPSAVVFCFHGSGGTIQKAAKQFSLQKHWGEAIVVYPAGMSITMRGMEKSGWVLEMDEQGKNRELAFIDEILFVLRREAKVDEQRIIAAGHSNGGFLNYFLWKNRSDLFAAIAPCACFARNDLNGLTAKPVFHTAGRTDPLVPLSKQLETFQKVKEINASQEGRPGKRQGVRIFPSATGALTVLYVHPGGHGYPEEAGPMIVRFFKDINKD